MENRKLFVFLQKVQGHNNMHLFIKYCLSKLSINLTFPKSSFDFHWSKKGKSIIRLILC